MAVTPLNRRLRSSLAWVARNCSNTSPIQSWDTTTRSMIWLTVGTAPPEVWCRKGRVDSGHMFAPAPKYRRFASYVHETRAAAKGPAARYGYVRATCVSLKTYGPVFDGSEGACS